jgi:hypothetical protein
MPSLAPGRRSSSHLRPARHRRRGQRPRSRRMPQISHPQHRTLALGDNGPKAASVARNARPSHVHQRSSKVFHNYLRPTRHDTFGAIASLSASIESDVWKLAARFPPLSSQLCRYQPIRTKSFIAPGIRPIHNALAAQGDADRPGGYMSYNHDLTDSGILRPLPRPSTITLLVRG